MRNRAKPRLAIIGCGAVVEQYHLPALRRLGWQPALLVDPDVARVRGLTRNLHRAKVSEFLEQTHLDEIDAAIVATPPFLHAPLCMQLLHKGIHILVEKPMATTVEECHAMIAAANASGARMAVGFNYHYMPIRRWTMELLRSGLLGKIQSFDIREGFVFDWPATSDSIWRKELTGGGVLMDYGSHTLDLLLWWLGDVDTLEYLDDSYDGVEADCLLKLGLKSGAKGVIELSRTRDLRNSAIIEGTEGRIEVDLEENEVIEAPEQILRFRYNGMNGTRMSKLIYGDMYVQQLREWLEAIREKREPAISGHDGLRSLKLIRRCYEQRQRWELPWVRVKDHKSECVVRSA